MADDADNFVKPIASGLSKMLSQAGIESKLFFDGLRFLDDPEPNLNLQFNSVSSFARSLKNRYSNSHKTFLNNFWIELASYQVMIVVETMPTAYLRYQLHRIEKLRTRFPKMIIVLYDLLYLSTIGEWIGFLKNGNDYHGMIKGSGHFGLERYDWYLVGSASTDYPMPKGFQPLSEVGCNINDGSLFPEQSEFRALIDFERPNHMKERAIQILALEKTNTPYTVLHGRYPMAEIRKIYRQTSIYFLAHLEAFGLPIAEVQACGGLVFSPYARWAWAHYHKPDLTLAGEGKLSDNFRIYHNDLDTLCRMIEEAKANFNAQQNLAVFKSIDKRFYEGSADVLKDFIAKLKSGEIHSKRHEEFLALNALITKPC